MRRFFSGGLEFSFFTTIIRSSFFGSFTMAASMTLDVYKRQHQYHGIGTCGKEVFKPLDTLNIQVVGRFVEQQHIGTAKQEFGKFRCV